LLFEAPATSGGAALATSGAAPSPSDAAAEEAGNDADTSVAAAESTAAAEGNAAPVAACSASAGAVEDAAGGGTTAAGATEQGAALGRRALSAVVAKGNVRRVESRDGSECLDTGDVSEECENDRVLLVSEDQSTDEAGSAADASEGGKWAW
jgi:hypothetical protein